ncbi:uncharacterized protein G2W53_038648 [Senna tora]|uniref:Uncharacterized protein n=1 Tax=Senna tora TaxID=362788 RepID=A0A834SMF5_9FABA|nr:uncharacterized protein G2W53_038648 [Senna tora]
MGGVFDIYETHRIMPSRTAGGGGSSSRRRRRRGGVRRSSHDQATFAPRPPHRIRDVAADRLPARRGFTRLVVEGAAAVPVVGPALDAVVEAGETTFEDGPENAVRGGGHVPRRDVSCDEMERR